MTQELFTAFGEDLTAQFDRLVGRGVDANQAMLLMQPSLQTLWELQQNFGFAVDDGTQGLLDQAEAAGFIGGAFQDDMEQVRDILLAIAEALGAQIPGYFAGIREETGGILNDIEGQWSDTWGEMSQVTQDELTEIERLWNSLPYTPKYSGPTSWEMWDGVRSGYRDPITGEFHYDTPKPTGTTPIPKPGDGGCCCVHIDTLIVTDGTATSVGRMALRAINEEIEHGGAEVTRLRENICDLTGC